MIFMKIMQFDENGNHIPAQRMDRKFLSDCGCQVCYKPDDCDCSTCLKEFIKEIIKKFSEILYK